jgi:hypothetical protein
MKEQYIFTQTASGDRTNIMSSFPLWNKEMFLERVNSQKSRYHGRYRYGKIGGYVSLLKDMLLDEFEQVFSADEFTTEQITELFRKEISEKYGKHAEDKKIKPLSKKELERGCIYEDFTGGKWLYYGEVEQIIDTTYYETYKFLQKPVEIKVGLGFQYYYNADHKPSHVVDVIKSPKKLKSKVEGIKFQLNDKYTYETGKKSSSWDREFRLELKLL